MKSAPKSHRFAIGAEQRVLYFAFLVQANESFISFQRGAPCWKAKHEWPLGTRSIINSHSCTKGVCGSKDLIR